MERGLWKTSKNEFPKVRENYILPRYLSKVKTLEKNSMQLLVIFIGDPLIIEHGLGTEAFNSCHLQYQEKLKCIQLVCTILYQKSTPVHPTGSTCKFNLNVIIIALDMLIKICQVIQWKINRLFVSPQKEGAFTSD